MSGKEAAERFAKCFTRDYGYGRIYRLEQCRVISDAAGHLRPDLEYFGNLIGVPSTSADFDMACFLGNEFSEWDGANILSDWIALTLLAIPNENEHELIMDAGKRATEGSFQDAMRELLMLQRRHRGKIKAEPPAQGQT